MKELQDYVLAMFGNYDGLCIPYSAALNVAKWAYELGKRDAGKDND